MAFETGSAYVTVFPSLRGWQTKIRTEVKSKFPDGLEIPVKPKFDAGTVRAEAETVAKTSGQTVKFKAELDRKSMNTSIVGLAALARAMRTLTIPTAIVATTPYLLSLAGSAVTAAQSLSLLPAAMTAGGVAAGTLIVGLRGIGDAFKELIKRDEQAADTAEASAKARQAAMKSVRSAAESLADAQRAADRAAVDGAEQVADARRALADAITAAQERIRAAEERVTDARKDAQRAQESLTRSQEAAQRAQEDLTRARRDAREELQQLQFSIEGAGIAEEEAIERLEKAQYRLNKAREQGASAATIEDLDREVRKADLALRETSDRYEDLQREGQEWAESGIDGSRGVEAAQRRVEEANRGVRDSQRQLAEANARIHEAEAAVVQARVDGDKAVADARRDLGRTIVSVGQQQADAARNVERATRALAEAQREAATAGMEGPDDAAKAMAKLSGAARSLVNEIRALGPAWTALRLDVQERLLSGIAARVGQLGRNYLPILNAALGTTADGFNRAFRNTLDWLNTAGAMATVRTTMDNVAVANSNAARAIQPLTQAFWDLAAVGSTFLPNFGNSIANAADRFRDFIAEARATGDLRRWIQDGVDAMRQLWQLTKNLGRLFVGVFNAAQAAGEPFLDVLVRITGRWADALQTPEGAAGLTGFFTGIRTLVEGFLERVKMFGPSLAAAGAAFMALFTAAAPFTDALLSLVTTILPPFFRFLELFAPTIGPMLAAMLAISLAMKVWTTIIWLWNAALLANPIGLIIVALTALVGGIIYAWNNFEWFRGALIAIWDALKVAWNVLMTAFKWAWDNILKPVWNAIVAAAKWMWEKILKPLFADWKTQWDRLLWAMKWMWDNILKPVWDAIVAAARWMWRNVLKPIFDYIKYRWELTGIAIRHVWRNVIKPAWDALVSGLGWVRDRFREAIEFIGRKWDQLRGLLAKPINAIIRTVFNNGILRAWNWAAKLLPGIGPAEPVKEFRWAKGGIHEDHQAQVTKAGGPLRIWSEPETGGEAYIPLARRKRRRSEGILADVAERFDMQVVPNNLAMFADGGLWRRMFGVVQRRFPRARLTSGYRPGDPGYHGRGKAVDLAGPRSMDMGAMLRINRWLANNFANSTELIHTQPGATNLYRGRPHTYSAGTRADHRDHVHWALQTEAMLRGMPGNYTGGEGGGGGLRAMIRAFFEKMTNGLINRLPKAPPQWANVGRGVATKARDMLLDFLLGKAGDEDGPATAGSGPVRAQVRAVSHRFGWGDGAQWAALDRLIQKESSWNPTAQNPISTAYGLYQFLNSTWATVGGRKTSNPGLQAEYGNRYIRKRYGNPVSALAFHNRNNWYDAGGTLAPGFGTYFNGTRSHERVLDPANTRSFDTLVHLISSGRLGIGADSPGVGGGPLIGAFTQNFYGEGSSAQGFDELEHRMRVARRGGVYRG